MAVTTTSSITLQQAYILDQIICIWSLINQIIFQKSPKYFCPRVKPFVTCADVERQETTERGGLLLLSTAGILPPSHLPPVLNIRQQRQQHWQHWQHRHQLQLQEDQPSQSPTPPKASTVSSRWEMISAGFGQEGCLLSRARWSRPINNISPNSTAFLYCCLGCGGPVSGWSWSELTNWSPTPDPAL